MFITKRRFEREIEKRLKKERRIIRIEEQVRQQKELGRRMISRIRSIEARLDYLEEQEIKKGYVKGYYWDKDGLTVTFTGNSRIMPTEQILDDKGTEPAG